MAKSGIGDKLRGLFSGRKRKAQEQADAARARSPETRVLFTTGYARNEIGREGRMEEGVALLPKPFTAAELARKVREELDR